MKTVQFIGRLSPVKGISDLLEAYSRLVVDDSMKSQIEEWCLKIVGPGEKSYTMELEQLAEKLGIANKVRFVGPVYGEALREEYKAADLFVLPTYSENFASVVIESLAAGVPVICTKGAPWEDLDAYGCGWWVDIGVDSIYNALRTAMTLPSNVLKQMGLKGKALVEKKYTWEAVCEEVMNGYNKVLFNR
jgi:glycosyltransferase involved in cell wall biosynthesis